MDEYKSNSIKPKRVAEEQQEKKIDKPVAAGKSKKKNGVEKIAENFLSEDVDNVKEYILSDVLIPAAKKTLMDIITNGLNMFLYGQITNGSNRGAASRVSYNSISSGGARTNYAVSANRNRAGYSYDDVIFDTRPEAEAVLDGMCAALDKYGSVSVADLFDLSQITSNFTDNKYGWTNLSTSTVVRVRDGYMLKLPRALPLD